MATYLQESESDEEEEGRLTDLPWVGFGGGGGRWWKEKKRERAKMRAGMQDSTPVHQGETRASQ